MPILMMVYGTGQTTYALQQSMDSVSWQTLESGAMSTAMVRNHYGMEFHYSFTYNGLPAKIHYRLLVQDVKTGLHDTSNVVFALESGIDDNGNAWFICPGETETINITVSKKLVVFDGVYGNCYPKQLDFTTQGFGKVNGYYAQAVNCGGSVIIPDDPEMEGYIFTGWKSWDDSEYADDAYLNVPATNDNIIGFTAEFEPIPEDIMDGIEEVIQDTNSVQTRKVIYNGQLFIIRPDGKIYNAQGMQVR